MSAITQLAARAGEVFRQNSAKAGLETHSNAHFGIASGVDIALTIFEQGTGVVFDGMSTDSARFVVQYFSKRAGRMERIDPYIAIGYRAWSTALAELHINN